MPNNGGLDLTRLRRAARTPDARPVHEHSVSGHSLVDADRLGDWPNAFDPARPRRDCTRAEPVDAGNTAARTSDNRPMHKRSARRQSPIGADRLAD